MKTTKKHAVFISCISALILSACATSEIKLEDRDRSGTYDGVWLAEVGSPRSSQVTLNGNWQMGCGWEPYEVYFVVDDGLVQLGKIESKTAISSGGDFYYKLDAGPARQNGGVMPGNPRFIQTFSASLSDETLKGRYQESISGLGGNGCSANILYRKLDESEL